MNDTMMIVALSTVLFFLIAMYPVGACAVEEIFELAESGVAIIFNEESGAAFKDFVPTSLPGTGQPQRDGKPEANLMYELAESGLIITFSTTGNMLSAPVTLMPKAQSNTGELSEDTLSPGKQVDCYELCESGILIEFD
jgi:hypothetical protein